MKERRSKKHKCNTLMRRNEARVKRETILHEYQKTMRKRASCDSYIQRKTSMFEREKKQQRRHTCGISYRYVAIERERDREEEKNDFEQKLYGNRGLHFPMEL